MYVLSIKVPIRKKSGDLSNAPRIYIYIYMHIYVTTVKVLIYLIRYIRQSLSAYYYFNPFKSPYSCFNIRLKLANKFSVTNWFISIFVFHSSHHHGVCTLRKYNTAFFFYWCNFFYLFKIFHIHTHTHTHIYIYIYISSNHRISSEFPNFLSPLVLNINHSW